MPVYDANLSALSQGLLMNVTDTTTPTNQYGVGANAAPNWLDLKTTIGLGHRNPLVVTLGFASAATTSGTGTFLPQIIHADDNGSGSPGTGTVLCGAVEGALSFSTAAVTGLMHLVLARPKRWINLNGILHGSGAAVYVNYANIGLTDP